MIATVPRGLATMFEWARGVCRRLYRYRSLRVTPEGIRFLVLTLGIGVAALNTGNNLLYLLLAMMLSLIVLSGILSEHCLKDLIVRRTIPPHIFAGRPAMAAFSVRNGKGRFPSFSLGVMDVADGKLLDRNIHLLHVPAGATVARSYPLVYAQRGRYVLDGLKFLTRFPFGLFTKAASVACESEVIVYPTPQPLPQALLHDLEGAGYDHEMPRRGQGAALYNLRDYHSEDDSRTIHWKTSARQSRLIVRESEAEDQRRVTLAMPVQAAHPMPAAFERAVILMASLAAYFHARGFAIRVLLGDEELIHGADDAHLYRIFRMLALCREIHDDLYAAIPESLLRLNDISASEEFTVLVLPWPDARLASACRGVGRIIHADQEGA